MSDRPCDEPGAPGGRAGFLGALSAAARNRCPACGEGRFFTGFLEPAERCEQCGASFTEHAAGDGGIFVTLTALSIVAIGGGAVVELMFRPPIWLFALGVLAAGALLTATLLPFSKRFFVAQSYLMSQDDGAER